MRTNTRRTLAEAKIVQGRMAFNRLQEVWRAIHRSALQGLKHTHKTVTIINATHDDGSYLIKKKDIGYHFPQ